MKGINVRKYKFKVVKNKTNKSCIINGNSKFSLLYEKDLITYAQEGTLGVMVFKTRRAAERWSREWHSYIFEYAPWDTPWKIKRVIPIGRGKTPGKIALVTTSEGLEKFYKGNLYERDIDEPVPGTICYPAVFVID